MLAIHPPVLFTGYVLYAITFSLVIAGMFRGFGKELFSWNDKNVYSLIVKDFNDYNFIYFFVPLLYCLAFSYVVQLYQG